MLTKDEAIAIAKAQFGWSGSSSKELYKKKEKTYGMPWHYGRCDVADLLSQIYGEPVYPRELQENFRKEK